MSSASRVAKAERFWEEGVGPGEARSWREKVGRQFYRGGGRVTNRKEFLRFRTPFGWLEGRERKSWVVLRQRGGPQADKKGPVGQGPSTFWGENRNVPDWNQESARIERGESRHKTNGGERGGGKIDDGI